MLNLIEFPEGIEHKDQKVVIPAPDVEQLVRQFGSKIRGMGHWNKTTDYAVEVPIANIAAVTREIGDPAVARASKQLSLGNALNGLLGDPAAGSRLVEALSDLYMQQFGEKVERFQASTGPAEADRLWAEISHALFE